MFACVLEKVCTRAYNDYTHAKPTWSRLLIGATVNLAEVWGYTVSLYKQAFRTQRVHVHSHVPQCKYTHMEVSGG